MTETIYAEYGIVRACIADGYDREHTDLTPAEAREHAAELLAAAEQADTQLAAIAAACADGHDIASCNSHPTHPDRFTTHTCRRPGCRHHQVTEGWLPFEPKTHQTRWGTSDCYGPGCTWCDAEAKRAAR